MKKMKTNKTAKFQTPHEQAKATTPKEKKSKANKFVWQPGDVVITQPEAKKEEQGKEKKSAKAKPSPKETKKAGRDAWGGRLGTRMSKINLAVINAGKEGATTAEVAEKTKETPSLVSAQLYYHLQKGNCTRKEEKADDGKKLVRWTAKA